MKDILTRITESIGDNIAKKDNKNIFLSEKLHLNDDIKINTRPPLTVDIGDISWKDILIALDKEDKTLLGKVKDFIETSDYIANKYQKKPKGSPSLPSRSRTSSSSCSPSRRYSSGGCYSPPSRGGC